MFTKRTKADAISLALKEIGNGITMDINDSSDFFGNFIIIFNGLSYSSKYYYT